MGHDEPRCADRSRAAAEPLAGTALTGLRYLVLVPFRGTWAPRPLETPGLPAPLVRRLKALPPQARAVLVKRPARHQVRHLPALEPPLAPRGAARPAVSAVARRDGGGPRPPADATGAPAVVWVADVRAGTLRAHEAASWEALAEGDLLGPPAATTPAHPVVLVCTHGKRDRCCAVDGVPFARALDALGVWVWESSHLGGHRFAATALTLPDGYQYGRLTPGDALGFARALRARHLYRLDRLRGHVGRDGPSQAAEIFARQRWGLHAAHGVRVEATEAPEGGCHRLRVRRAEGAPLTVDVRRAPLDVPVPASCGGSPRQGIRWVCEPVATRPR